MKKNKQRLNRKIFNFVQIIGQFDKKFIILKDSHILNCYIAVDQHALHERILLEKGAKNPCRMAVKFNDSLSKEFMCYLIKEIQNLKNPFVCAHGRPCFSVIKFI